MKTILTSLIIFSLSTCGWSQTIRVNAGLDSVTNTRQKAELTAIVFNGKGEVEHISYVIRKYALNNITLAVASGSETKRTLLESKEYVFHINGKWVNTVTKVIVADSTNANHAKLQRYLSTKAINSYPGVAGTSQLKLLIEGVLKEVIIIKQASGQLPQ